MKALKGIFIISIIVLLVIGFFAPPRGSIDASIFVGASLLWGFYKLWEVYKKVERGEDGEWYINGTYIKIKKKKKKTNIQNNEERNITKAK